MYSSTKPLFVLNSENQYFRVIILSRELSYTSGKSVGRDLQIPSIRIKLILPVKGRNE